MFGKSRFILGLCHQDADLKFQVRTNGIAWRQASLLQHRGSPGGLSRDRLYNEEYTILQLPSKEDSWMFLNYSTL